MKHRLWWFTDAADAHRDVGEGRSHHEVEDPGLLLQDVGGREDHPHCGQDEEEDGGEEGQEGFVQAPVLQRVTAMTSEKNMEEETLNTLRPVTTRHLNQRHFKTNLLQDVVKAHG